MQRHQFPTIQTQNTPFFSRVREFYLHEEPSMLAAICRRDLPAAIESINRVLVLVYSHGSEHSAAFKGLLIELMVTLSRTAVDAGADETDIWEKGYADMVRLAELEDDEGLAEWLRYTVRRLIDSIPSAMLEKPDPVVARSMKILRQNCAEPLTRQQVAQMAGVSASHLAEIFKKRLGRSFTELLIEARLAMACDLLKRTDEKIANIAVLSGFSDQSHLTRVFRQFKGVTPRQFRSMPEEKPGSPDSPN